MVKRTTNSYVFKFVGGEPGYTRPCFYCRKEVAGGMVCVYSNRPGPDDEMYVCPKCLARGCKESERQWAELVRRAKAFGIEKGDLLTAPRKRKGKE